MRSNLIKNGSMQLELLANGYSYIGDYAIYKDHNRKIYPFIMAWLPVYELNEVSWSQGYYDIESLDQAIELMTTKTYSIKMEV